MKWVTFISCLFLISFAESKHLPRKYRDVVAISFIPNHCPVSVCSTMETFEIQRCALGLFAQYMQKASFQDVAKETTDIVELFKKCKTGSDDACGKHLGEIFRNEICHDPEIVAKLEFTDCCAKTDPERNECILSHKNDTPGFIPPIEKPSVEVGCKAFEDNKAEVLSKYIYEVGRRTPKVNVIVILHAAKEYEAVLTTCCHAEDKEGCFKEKAQAVKKAVKRQVIEQQITCSILKKPGRRALAASKFAQLSQKFPKASFETILKLTEDIVDIHEQVCKGDTLESLTERAELVDYTCSHKDDISTKLGPCCEKPVLEQTACIVALENDDKPADLSPTVREFIDDPETCKHYHDNAEKHLANFAYQYGRRHPEFSPQLIVRASKGYEDLLKKCCAAENAKECLAGGEALLQKHITDTLEFLKTNCDLHESLGDYFFQNLLLVLYTKKAPQLTNEELLQYTSKLTTVANDCCHLDDSHKLVCAEGKTDFVIGSICLRHQHHPINHQICQCCSDSYSFRRECLTALGTDPQYVPIPFEPEFHEDLCSTDEHEQHLKKQNILINLVKHKPDLTLAQQHSATEAFNAVLEKCCKAENHEACFKEEGPKLIENVKHTLGEH
ncbi:alpha-fetoprotein-like [Tiliqua scincoides]|uniref:alpha-fetoprotein-like n=1 Tax=Tiliqua scincoides TaxID=71010 RepID=UPI003462C2DB